MSISRTTQPFSSTASKPASATFDEYLTIDEVAAILKISSDTAIRRFGRERGVIDLGTPETRSKRRQRMLRIPRQTLERVIIESRVR